jgi:F-box protein 9
MDPEIDRHYKEKYFPVGGGVGIVSPRQEDVWSGYSIAEYQSDSHVVEGLTSTFTSLEISQFEPEDPSKPCYISILPDELLLQILLHLTLSSLSGLQLTSLINKKFLSLVQTETSLYKSLCIHYLSPFLPLPRIVALGLTFYNNDFRHMLIERPRLRFGGVYIATCHYLRPGQSDLSWNTPIHMVTYYRYVRFFPGGECVCVLSTVEPKEVVHAVTRECQLKGACFGTWTMEEEGEVSIQIAGARRYTFLQGLQVRSTMRGKHNKLVWVKFSSVNDEGERTVWNQGEGS